MKFAVIPDLHFGPTPMYKDVDRIMSSRAEEVLTSIISELKKEAELGFVVQLGDLIQESQTNPDPGEDRKSLAHARRLLSELHCPVYHVCGNHDTATLGVEGLCAGLDYPQLFYSFDAGDVCGVVLCSLSLDHASSHISTDQQTWLQETLHSAGKDVVVFVHHSLADMDLTGNFWFDGTPERALIHERVAVRKILKEAGNVRAVINGHLHWNNIQFHESIPYVTVCAAVEDYFTNGQPVGTYGIGSVDHNALNFSVRGKLPLELSWPNLSDVR